jgi:hypothetical protein
MFNKTLFTMLALMTFIGGCKNEFDTDDEADTDVSNDIDTDVISNDIDIDTDTDTDTDATTFTGTEGFALCSAGGAISDGLNSALFCLSPVQVGTGRATDGTHTLEAGSFFIVSP